MATFSPSEFPAAGEPPSPLLVGAATALVLPLLLIALAVAGSALVKSLRNELAPAKRSSRRRERRSSSSRGKPSMEKARVAPPPPPAPLPPAEAVMAALTDPSLQVRVSGLLTRNPPGGGALFRGELLDGSPVAVFVARRQCGDDDGAFNPSTSTIPARLSIPPLLGAGAAHPNVVQLFAVRETLVRGGCGSASGALLPPARGHWASTSPSSAANRDAPLSLAAALAAAGAPLPDSFSPSTDPCPPLPEVETVAVYEFCERGTLRDAIRAWAATAAAAKSRLGASGGGGSGASSSSVARGCPAAVLTPFDPSTSPPAPPDDAHLRVKTLLEVARGLARVHGGSGGGGRGRPHGALCAENVVLASSDADRRGFVAKLAAFSRPPTAGVGAGVGAWGAAPPGLAPELVEAARGKRRRRARGCGDGGSTRGRGEGAAAADKRKRRGDVRRRSRRTDPDDEIVAAAGEEATETEEDDDEFDSDSDDDGASAPSSSSSSSPPLPPSSVPLASFEADVYAFGVLAWEVAASADAGLLPPPLPTATLASPPSPFDADALELGGAGADEEALLSSWPCCRALGALATQCLSPLPEARPSVAQLLRSLAALEERLRADVARSELDYLFAAVNARQAPLSSTTTSTSASTSSGGSTADAPLVRASAPVAAALAAAAGRGPSTPQPSGKGAGGAEIDDLDDESSDDDDDGGFPRSAASPPAPLLQRNSSTSSSSAPVAVSTSRARPFTEDIFFGMPSPPAM